jgi:putative ABC transport system permease protein
MKRAAIAAYSLALLAFPRRHRSAYADEMLDAFARDLEARSHHSRIKAARFAIAACVNAIDTGLDERRRQRHRRFGPLFSALDVVLAWRMLLRYPGLSLVAVMGIAVGIAIASGAYAIMSTISNPMVPLDEGDRVVSLVNWDASTSNRDRRMVHDFTQWRAMTTLVDVSITRTVQRTLMISGRPPEVVTVAEISAAAFRVARVAAFRGRFLLPEDEAAGAPDTLVIGYDEWVRRFDADPAIVGRSVQLGSTSYAIAGVMPEGFVFPLNHDYWIPWRIDATTYQPRSGPAVNVFARLALGATLDSAQAELATIGERAAALWPATHTHLRPRVVPYPYVYNDMDDPENVLVLQAVQLAIVLLLVVVCVNVSILVYARTATRQGEIAVRGALGASRRRIVAQLFVEALMLAGIAATAGVGLSSVALQQLQGQMLLVGEQVLPFWMSLELPADGVLYIVALTLLAAAIIGVAPALKATGRQVHSGVQSLSAGSGSRMQMGRLWTTLIVAQVAVTVAVMPMAMFLSWTAIRFRTGNPGFASGEFLTAQLLADRATEPDTDAGERAFTRRVAASHRELDRRLREQSVVSDVTFSLTGVGEERAMVIEIEGREPPIDAADYNIIEGSKQGHLVRFNRVATNFFEAYDVPVIMGRAFMSSDATAADTVRGVLVNRSFVDLILSGANPLGMRVRYVGRSREANERDVVLNRWYEIVGVVPDFPTLQTADTERESKVYHAAAFGDIYPIELAVRMHGADPMAFAPSFREISAAADPNLQLRDVATAEIVLKREQGLMRLIGLTVIVVLLSVVGLTAAGMYALMSFTVSRRRREIGIRAALGAERNRLLIGIFARALGQLGAGAAAGLLGAIAFDQIIDEGDQILQGQGALLVPIVIVTIMVVGVLAAIGPARRGLKIQPIEALREE